MGATRGSVHPGRSNVNYINVGEKKRTVLELHTCENILPLNQDSLLVFTRSQHKVGSLITEHLKQ